MPRAAAFAQASIVVVNTATGTRYTATSDAEGTVRARLLPPATTRRALTAQGMSPQVTPQLHVDVGGAADLEFRLTDRGRAGDGHACRALHALVETKTSCGLDAARRTRRQRSSAERPPLLRSRAALAGRHARSTQPDVGHQRRSFVRRHSRIPEQLPGRRRRLQQRLLRAGPRTLSRALPVLHRSGAGVSRLRRIPTAPNWDARAARSSTSSPSPARITCTAPRSTTCATVRSGRRIRFSPSSRTTGSSKSEARSAVPLKQQQDFLLRGIRSAHLSRRPTSSNFSTAVRKSCRRPRHRPYTPGDYEATDQAAGLRRRRATDVAGRRVSGRADRQLVLCQARHQSHARAISSRCA